MSLKKIPEADLLRVASEYGCAKVEDLHAGLGYGKYSARQVLGKLAPEATEQPETESSEDGKQGGGITSVVRRIAPTRRGETQVEAEPPPPVPALHTDD